MRWFILTLIFLFPLGQLGRISIFNHKINFYLYEIMLIPVSIFILFEFWRHRLVFNRFLVILGFWLAITFFMRVGEYNWQVNLVGFLYLMRLVVYGLITAYLPMIIRRYLNEFWVDIVIKYLILTLILFGVLQYVFLNSFYNLRFLGWDPHTNRLVGTFFEPPVAGAIYGITLLWLYYNPKIIYGNALRIIFIFMMLLTFSRGAYVALGLTSIYVFLSCKLNLKQFFNKLILIVFFLTTSILGIIMITPGESTNLLRQFTIYSRIENYQKGLKLAGEYWLFGVGYNRLGAHIDNQPSHWGEGVPGNASSSFHSSFLIVLTTMGVVGLVLFIIYLFSLAEKSKFMRTVLVFLSILALFDNVLLHPFILLYLSLLQFDLKKICR